MGPIAMIKAAILCFLLLLLMVRPRTWPNFLLCAVVTPPVALFAVVLRDQFNISYDYDAHRWAVFTSTIVACILFLGVAVRASTCISSERDKNTFDFLLSTPLDSDTILWGKFLGCLYSMRLPLVWLCTIWWLALWIDGMYGLDVFLQFLALMIYATVFTQIGLWFSMVCRNGTRATVGTIFAIIVLSGGHWLPTLFCFTNMHSSSGMDEFTKFQLGFTPPAVLGILPALVIDSSHGVSHNEYFVYCAIGLIFYAVGSFVFWFRALSPRFRTLTHREELRVDEPRP